MNKAWDDGSNADLRRGNSTAPPVNQAMVIGTQQLWNRRHYDQRFGECSGDLHKLWR